MVLVCEPLLVRSVEEAPKEALAERLCRSVDLDPRLGVVAVEHDADWIAEVLRNGPLAGDLLCFREHDIAEIRAGELVGVLDEVPEADEPV